MSRCKKVAVLFVGHLPPPWTGQGVIHQMLLEGTYTKTELVPIVMNFSKRSADQGNISLPKIWSLCRLIAKSYYARFFQGILFLYFSPGGPSFSAVLRDAIYLSAVRPVMRRTMLVYHSSGVAQYIESSPAFLRPFLRSSFYDAEIAVQLSPSAPPDGTALRAREVTIIPNAVPDHAGNWFPRKRTDKLNILYMGIVTEGKGVCDLLDACRILAERKIYFHLTIAGSFASSDEEARLRRSAQDLPSDSLSFAGPLTGVDKEHAFRAADVFCFPSFWHTETFPLVLLEALSFGLPIVASRWRGIPDLLGTEQDCGILVDTNSIDQISAALEAVALNPDLRDTLSRNSRLRYELLFTTAPFFQAYDAVFARLVHV